MSLSKVHSNGVVPSLRTWLFGERDPIDRRLRSLERDGMRGVALAHFCASLFTILFSLESLVGLSSDALNHVVGDWSTGRSRDIPEVIGIVVSICLVICMDGGRYFATKEWRRLRDQRAERSAILPHVGIIVAVAVAQAGTFIYASWKFDHPADWMAWMLIIIPACMSPVLSNYLGLRRPLPVSPKDIFQQAELAASRGVIRDIVAEASDASALLTEKMAWYAAAADMTPADRERLDQLIAVAQQRKRGELPSSHTEAPLSNDRTNVVGQPDERRLAVPSGRGKAATVVSSGHRRAEGATSQLRNSDATIVSVSAANRQHNGSRSNVRTLPSETSRPTPRQSVRANAGRRAAETEDLRRRRESAAEQIMSAMPDIGPRELGRQIAEATGTACSESTAHQLYEKFRARSA